MGTIVHDCPHCGATSSTFTFGQDLIALRQTRYGSYSADALASCGNCSRAVFFVINNTYSDHVHIGPANIQGNIKNSRWTVSESHPQRPSTDAPQHTPHAAANALSGALKSLQSGIWQGAGMLARRSVELSLKETKTGAKQQTLNKAIKELREDNDIPEYVADWSDHVRVLGNEAAHGDEIGEADAREAVTFARELALTLFTRPAEIALVRQKYHASEDDR